MAMYVRNAILGYVTYVEIKIKFKSKKPEVEVMMYEQQVNYMIWINPRQKLIIDLDTYDLFVRKQFILRFPRGYI